MSAEAILNLVARLVGKIRINVQGIATAGMPIASAAAQEPFMQAIAILIKSSIASVAPSV
jgi:hypothetical protein